VAFAGWWLFVRFTGPMGGVEYNALVGYSEAAIKQRYGAPAGDTTGYQALGIGPEPSLPQGPIRSLTFFPGRLWHPRGGTLEVWLVQQDGQWVCFQSCWYADDVRF
jgi:hypothetical protein